MFRVVCNKTDSQVKSLATVNDNVAYFLQRTLHCSLTIVSELPYTFSSKFYHPTLSKAVNRSLAVQFYNHEYQLQYSKDGEHFSNLQYFQRQNH